MREAFAGVYGRWDSPAAKVFGPVIEWRTYLRAVHLAAMFPLGIAYFVVVVTMFAVGGALIWTVVGPLVLIPLLFITRWAGDGEAWAVRHLVKIELRRPPTAIDLKQSPRSQIWTRLIDPSTWTGLIYLIFQFPIGIATFVMLTVAGAVAGMLTGAPILVATTDFATETHGWHLGFDRWMLGVLLVPVGLLSFLILVHLVNAFSALHAVWARLLLGSRAKNIPALPNHEPEPPDPGPGTPVASALPARPPVATPPTQQPAEGISGIASLTAREKEVLMLIARGHSNAEIGEALVISEGTVKTHVKRVLAKLELRDRTQASVYAYETGFVVPRVAEEPTPIGRRRKSV